MKKMKNVLNKMLAALVITASMTSLCAPAYAEEAPVRAEEAYTVTEDEQGTVTIVFNEPIVLSREESYAGSEAEEDDGIMPCEEDYPGEDYPYIPEAYWGNYISTAGNFTLSIVGRKRIFFEGRYNFDGPNLFWHVFCYYDNVKLVSFTPTRNKTGGLMIHYNPYAIITDTENKRVDSEIVIDGWYDQKTMTFTISGIIYHPEK